MFTEICFIKKNTPELREKLDKLGYKYTQSLIKNREEILFLNRGYYSNNFPYSANVIAEAIGCRGNEELFLALAALRDDTDKNQWFIYDSRDCEIESMRLYEWFICHEDSIKDMLFYDSHYLNARKATVEEIIEHFKTNTFKIKIGDIVEHKNKHSESGYSHDGKYIVSDFCRMKNPTTGEWVDSVIYQKTEKLDISLIFVREKTDFENKFKIVENGSKDN